MKTRNNVQKAGLRIIATIVSFVLISYTVSAQNFWRELFTINSFGELAEAMIEPSTRPVRNTNITDSYSNLWFGHLVSKVQENNLYVENWMFNDISADYSATMLKGECEPVLEMEEWMFSESEEKHEDLFARVKEEELTFKEWMIK